MCDDSPRTGPLTNKRTHLPVWAHTCAHVLLVRSDSGRQRRQRPGRVEGVLSLAAMACGPWHAAWLGCLAHASAAASRSRVQASAATALGVYQRAMSSLARAPRAAASAGCSSTVRMARRSSRTEGCEGWARRAMAKWLPSLLAPLRSGSGSHNTTCRHHRAEDLAWLHKCLTGNVSAMEDEDMEDLDDCNHVPTRNQQHFDRLEMILVELST